MPRNYFADPLETGMDAFDRGYQRQGAITRQMQTTRANRAAAPKIAAGDYGGAAQAYADNGMADETLAMRGQAEQQDERAKTEEAARQQAQARQVQERFRILTGVATHLMKVPAGQRFASLQEAMPLFQMAGIDTQQFGTLTEDQLSDAALQAFTGEVQKAAEQYTLPPGAKRFDETGRMVAENPVAERPISVPQGGTLYDPKQRKPIYTAPKTFAPPRSSGGGASAGPVVDVNPNSVKWD